MHIQDHKDLKWADPEHVGDSLRALVVVQGQWQKGAVSTFKNAEDFISLSLYISIAIYICLSRALSCRLLRVGEPCLCYLVCGNGSCECSSLRPAGLCVVVLNRQWRWGRLDWASHGKWVWLLASLFSAPFSICRYFVPSQNCHKDISRQITLLRSTVLYLPVSSLFHLQLGMIKNLIKNFPSTAQWSRTFEGMIKNLHRALLVPQLFFKDKAPCWQILEVGLQMGVVQL